MNKNPLTAFLLSFIPGVGHAYLGRPIRCFLYGLGFFGPLAFLVLLMAGNSYVSNGPVVFLLMLSLLSAIVNMIDMIISLINGKHLAIHQKVPGGMIYSSVPQPGGPYSEMGANGGNGNGGYANNFAYTHAIELQQEKTKTILLSIIPGLGHMSIGLMQRGITLMLAFIGLFTIIIFISFVMSTSVLLIFLLVLPVIWIYSMFDVVSQLSAKQRGEMLEDRSIFDELEAHVASGRKNKVIAISLSIFPGAGHLYLGLQKRGLQLMAGFLVIIYIMDSMRLSLFLFLLPLLWFYAFFDALHYTSKYEYEKLVDKPILSQIVPYQRWLGIAFLLVGVYYLLDRVAAELISRYWIEGYHQYLQFKYMIPTAITAFVLISIGLRLAFGGKRYMDAAYVEPPPMPNYKTPEREGGES